MAVRFYVCISVCYIYCISIHIYVLLVAHVCIHNNKRDHTTNTHTVQGNTAVFVADSGHKHAERQLHYGIHIVHIYPSIHICIYLSIHPYLPIYPSISSYLLFIHVYLSIHSYLPIYLLIFAYLSGTLSWK